ncbi:conserved hypothetical protein [Candidatus Terasakiella magnetica]|nr:conserved hypothetical protein [Candidatus Terasakiella magnetica]
MARMAAEKTPPKKLEERRTNGLIAVAVLSDRVTRPVFGKKGFAGGALVVDWPVIVGSLVASHTLPVRIRFRPNERTDGTLVVKVDSGSYALEVQHLEPLILEKINGYFGWKAVARLKLMQGPLPEAPRKKAVSAAPALTTPARLARLDQVDDPDLRAVLERLSRYIAPKA